MAKIGRLDQRITFQSNTATADGMGGSVQAWGNVASVPTVWAQVVPKAAAERDSNDEINADGLYEFTVRNRSDISETDRIVWGGVNFNIRGIYRTGTRSLYLRIDAERGVAS